MTNLFKMTSRVNIEFTVLLFDVGHEEERNTIKQQNSSLLLFLIKSHRHREEIYRERGAMTYETLMKHHDVTSML